MTELRARVQALGRRSGRTLQAGGELRAGELVLDPVAHTVRYGPEVLDLSPTEWSLLEYMLRNRGQALSRQQILDYVWPHEATIQLSLVDVNISRLRRKLWRPNQPEMIETVRGIGYRLRTE
jgi:DNA-binding response OmpR family regulator